MALWTTRSQNQQARNGTTSHTFTFTAATAGQLLVAVVHGGVTFTTPAGWTLVNNAVNNAGLYVFRKVAAGGETSITTTTNSANYPAIAVVYAFPTGSTVTGSATKTSAGTSSFSGAVLTGLTGTNLIFGAGGQGMPSATPVPAWSAWSSSAVEDTDAGVTFSTTDGYSLGIAYLEDSVLTGWTPTATVTNPGATAEALTFAVNVAGGVAPPALPIIVLAPRR